MKLQEIKTIISSSTCLVTGGAGFIGSNLAIYLVELGAKKVIVLDDLSTGYESNLASISDHPSFSFIKGDIRDVATCNQACKGVDYVFHQAALGSVPRSIDNPIATNSVNVDGFLNMLNASRINGIKRFVYASSSSVYGDDSTMPKVEQLTGNLLSPYAVSKYTNEKYAKVFSRVYGIETIGLRYFNVFGPHQSVNGPYAAVIPLFVNALVNGKQPVIFGDGENTRDFTFITNVVKANIFSAISNKIGSSSPVLNIAFGSTISLNKLFTSIAEILHSDLKPIYGDERKGDIRNSWADISQARSLIDYEPVVEVHEGLVKTVEWFKKKID